MTKERILSPDDDGETRSLHSVRRSGRGRSYLFEDISLPESKIEVTSAVPAEAETDSILAAEVVVVGGRGAEEPESFALLKAFADKIGAAIGGTRPLADTGQIPFQNQIGQTGFTIRPKICISLGVSGAIQHTEGIKDTKLMVAINTDEMPRSTILRIMVLQQI